MRESFLLMGRRRSRARWRRGHGKPAVYEGLAAEEIDVRHRDTALFVRNPCEFFTDRRVWPRPSLDSTGFCVSLSQPNTPGV